jgi:site-specific DNA-cytosine methylase
MPPTIPRPLKLIQHSFLPFSPSTMAALSAAILTGQSGPLHLWIITACQFAHRQTERNMQRRPSSHRADGHGRCYGHASRRSPRVPHKVFGTDQDPRLEEPLHTVTAKDRFGLVMVHGEPYQIVDIGMRKLTPRELFRAQGFPDAYIIDPEFNGKPLTKTSQVRMCGNSVCPPLAEAIVRAQFGVKAIERAA